MTNRWVGRVIHYNGNAGMGVICSYVYRILRELYFALGMEGVYLIGRSRMDINMREGEKWNMKR